MEAPNHIDHLEKDEYEAWFKEVAVEAAELIDAFRTTNSAGDHIIYNSEDEDSLKETMRKVDFNDIVKVEFKGVDHNEDKWYCCDELINDLFIRTTNGENIIGIPREIKRQENE